jgi:ElaB/YqjD/DUF883 family membrane-anchored ribosome-binding protein
MGETRNEVSAAGENDPSQLREEIERTREGLSETIEEISERLTPRKIVNDAKDTLKQAAAEKVRAVTDTAGQVAGKVTDRARELTDRARDVTERARGATGDMVGQVRDDPWPTALVGVGLGWWLVQTLANRSSRRTSDVEGLDDSGAAGADNAGYAFEPAGSRSSWMRSSRVPAIASGLALAWCASRMMGDRRRLDRSYDPYGNLEQATDASAARSAAQSGRDWARKAQHARERVSEAAGQTAKTVGRVGRQAGERMSAATGQAQDWVSETVRDSPKSAGLVALALGVGVGLALPKR